MKRLIWIAVTGLFALTASAQYDPAFTNSWALQSYYNPAAAGVDGYLNIRGAYSMQMTGYEGAPKTMLVTADLPLTFWSPNHAAGAGFMNDAIGLFSHKKIYVQYALHIPLGWQKKSRISIGARLVILSEKFDGSGVDTDESNDKAFPTSEVSGFAIDAEIGARYTWSDVWYVGASAMHLTGPTIELGDDKVNEMKISPTFYLTGGYKLKFRDKRYCLDTHGILRSDFQAIRGDIVARLGYEGLKNKLYGGVLYSPTNSVGFLFGINFHGVEIGYSYEMYTGGVGLQNGTHEIVLGYQMDMKKSKKGKNMHKSVRFL